MTQPRVLVVDDNELDRTMARDFLQDGGFAVDTVSSGEAALEKLASTEYGLIVTDLVMPGIDGYALADEVKKRKGPPVILVTAEEKANSKHTASNLHKPYTKASLVTAARMLCKDADKAKAKAAAPAGSPSTFKRASVARRPDAAPEKKGFFKRLFGKD